MEAYVPLRHLKILFFLSFSCFLDKSPVPFLTPT